MNRASVTGRSLTGSTLIVLAGSAGALGGSVLVRLIMARSLAPAELGLVLVSLGVVTVLGSLASLGVNSAAAVRIAARRAEGDEDGAAATARTAVAVAGLGGAVAFGLLAAAPHLAAASGGRISPELAAILAALSPVCLALALGLAALGISRAHGESAPRAVLRDGGGGVLRAAAVGLGAAAGGGQTLFAASYGLASLVAESLLLAFVLARGWLRRSAGRLFDLGLLRRLPPFAALELVSQAHQWVDTLLVGALGAPVEVGFYALARSLTRALSLVAGAAHHTILPALGAAAPADLLALHRRGWRLVLALLSPAIAVGVLVPALPLRLLAGAPYVAAAPTLRILCLALLLDALGTTQEQVLLARGRASEATMARLLSAAATAALLPPALAAGGASFAALALAGGQLARLFATSRAISRLLERRDAPAPAAGVP